MENRVQLKVATLDDIPQIALNAREADEREVYAWARHTIVEALVLGITCSEFAVTAHYDGVPAVVFGVGRMNALGRSGIPWMLGTKLIDKHPKPFWKGSVEVVTAMRRRFRVLENWVDDRHVESKRWLGRLGFELEEPVVKGYAGLPFCRFSMKGEV